MDVLIKTLQVLLALSLLILVHEFGHYIFARIFKIRVEKFYLFFDPWFSIFKYKPKKSDTEYGIGWLPLGGYCKISGMIDESMDKEAMKQEPQPWEFRSKPAWQRLIIMLGGVTVNFFLAWFIYSSLSYFKGETFHDNAKFENGVAVSDAGQKMGLKTGDKILKIDGKPEERLEDSFLDILLSNEITVLRDGKEVNFAPNEDGIAHILGANEAKAYITPRFPAVVDSLAPNMPAIQAGLKKGDKITFV